MTNFINFRVGSDYRIAHHYTGSNVVTLDEWTGKTLEEFTKAMRRDPDEVEVTKLTHGRTITDYKWYE